MEINESTQLVADHLLLNNPKRPVSLAASGAPVGVWKNRRSDARHLVLGVKAIAVEGSCQKDPPAGRFIPLSVTTPECVILITT